MNIDVGAIKEVFLSLLISLGGLLLMSTTLFSHIENEYIVPMHYLFILNSILCFKNNIELNYADIMSSTIRRIAVSKKKIPILSVLEYVFDCGLKMFGISLITGVFIGVFSNYGNMFELLFMVNVKKNLVFIFATILSAFFSGVCGSISTFICVIACISLSIAFNFNPDNIVLPIIASSADYISTLSLLYFSENIYLMVSEVFPDVVTGGMVGDITSRKIFITNCVLIMCAVLILSVLYFKTADRRTPRLFSMWSLIGAFFITMVAGCIIDRVSKTNKWLGTMIPLFNGLSGSVALIYTGKITTYNNWEEIEDQNEVDLLSEDEAEESGEIENPNNPTTLCTLVVTAALLSLVSCLFIKILFRSTSTANILVIGVMLVVEVVFLYNLVNLFVGALHLLKVGIDCHVVPLLNASSDLLGTCVLAGAMHGAKFLQRP